MSMTRRLIGREWGSPLIGQTLRKPRPQPLKEKAGEAKHEVAGVSCGGQARPSYRTTWEPMMGSFELGALASLCVSLCLSSFKQCFSGCALMSLIIDAFDILIWLGHPGQVFPNFV